MSLVGVELATLVSEPDALTTRPPPCVSFNDCSQKQARFTNKAIVVSKSKFHKVCYLFYSDYLVNTDHKAGFIRRTFAHCRRAELVHCKSTFLFCSSSKTASNFAFLNAKNFFLFFWRSIEKL